jgi:hypothetical protein
MSILSKGLRAGFGTLSKGLYAKYESALKEEEREAQYLRDQHLALFEDSLLRKRTEAFKEIDRKNDLAKIQEEAKLRETGLINVAREGSKIKLSEKSSGYRDGDRDVPMAEYEKMTPEQKATLVKESEYQFSTQKQAALNLNDLTREIENINLEKDSNEAYDVYSAYDPKFKELVSRADFKRDMKLYHVASKGGTPLSNKEKIDLYKVGSESWDKLFTDNPDEYKARVASAKGKTPEEKIRNARSGFISDIMNDPEFQSTTSVGAKARSIVDSKLTAQEQAFISKLASMPYEQAVKTVMDQERVTEPEARKALHEYDIDPPKGEQDSGTVGGGLLPKWEKPPWTEKLERADKEEDIQGLIKKGQGIY